MLMRFQWLCCVVQFMIIQWKKNNVLKFISSMTKNWFQNLLIGLGAFLVEWSFFPENERMIKNDPIVKKNECLERVLKNIGMISKRMEQNGNCWKRTVKIVNAFLLSRTCSKLGMHLKSLMCFKSSRNSCLFHHLTPLPSPHFKPHPDKKKRNRNGTI